MVDQKITPEAMKRLRENPPKQVLRSMRELEILLLEHRAKKLRESLGADQDDINVAFEADGLSWSGQHERLKQGKGWEPVNE